MVPLENPVCFRNFISQRGKMIYIIEQMKHLAQELSEDTDDEKDNRERR